MSLGRSEETPNAKGGSLVRTLKLRLSSDAVPDPSSHQSPPFPPQVWPPDYDDSDHVLPYGRSMRRKHYTDFECEDDDEGFKGGKEKTRTRAGSSTVPIMPIVPLPMSGSPPPKRRRRTGLKMRFRDQPFYYEGGEC